MTIANDKSAQSAWALVQSLQSSLVHQLSTLRHLCQGIEWEGQSKAETAVLFQSKSWLRNGGTFGGGYRMESTFRPLFNQASANVSHVHYSEQPQIKNPSDETNRPLASATALSSIIHPSNPHCPSLHVHISWTAMKNGSSGWRLMADLNPSIHHEYAKEYFLKTLGEIGGKSSDQVQKAIREGESYFFIPALGRLRGVAHYYVENKNSGDFAQDLEFARSFGQGIIDAYRHILEHSLSYYLDISTEDRLAQLEYHTLYFFQVLTLDRGTTAGLLVHDENDCGILGSLPSHVLPKLLQSWLLHMPQANQPLLEGIIKVLATKPLNPEGAVGLDEPIKRSLAQCIRDFYKNHPEAIHNLARGSQLPSTLSNHGTHEPLP